MHPAVPGARIRPLRNHQRRNPRIRANWRITNKLGHRYTESLPLSRKDCHALTSLFVRRRDLLRLWPAAALAGCVPFANTSPFWGTIAGGLKGGVATGPAISRTYTDALPYASMIAWFDGAAKALLVLGEILPDQRMVWHSAERQTVTTFGPYVVSALGFERELRSSSLQGSWDANPALMSGRRVSRYIDVAVDGQRHQIALQSQFRTGKVENVEILDRDYRLTAVSERVSHDRRVRFVNKYWVDPTDGRCWKSRQTIVPTVPRLNIEVLKYPA